MSDIKNYLKIWLGIIGRIQIWFLLYISIFPFLMIAIMYFTSEPNLLPNQAIDIAYLMYMWLIMFGIVYSTKLFRMSMNIRANRVSYIYAMGIMTSLTGIIFGSVFYVVCRIGEAIGQYVGRLEKLQIIGTHTLGTLIVVSTVFVVLGCIIGSLYNRISNKVFWIGIVIVCFIIVFTQVGYVKLLDMIIGFLQGHMLMAILLGSIGFGISALNLKNTSIQLSLRKGSKHATR